MDWARLLAIRQTWIFASRKPGSIGRYAWSKHTGGHEFPSELRLAFAEIKFAKAGREAIEIINSSGNIAQASLRLAKAIPAWVSQKMPFINTRLNNALAHGNINSLGELDRLTPEQLERLPNIGLKSIESLFQYLQKNLMPLSKNSLHVS